MANETEIKATGTMGLENTLHENADRLSYDETGKKVLRYREVLANILKYSIPEYAPYTAQEIMEFIETDSITGEVPVAPDADTRIHGVNTEQSSIKEANLTFDVLFNVLKPDKVKVHLHVDIELQQEYNPGYSIEKRGIYHLSRMISSHLDVITKKTNYDKLQKVYSIFICVGNVPAYLHNTVSYYEFVNTQNIGFKDSKKAKEYICKSENYDLMGLIIVRISEKITENVTEIIDFLHGIFYDIEEVGKYIDFSQNEKLRKELKGMSLTGEHLIEYGRNQERERAEKEKERADQLEKELKEALEKIRKLEENNMN